MGRRRHRGLRRGRGARLVAAAGMQPETRARLGPLARQVLAL
jgi:hypothetical protein